MNPNAANEYLKAKVLTATPEQLQMMLYDGALKFAERGKLALEAKNFDQSYHSLTRAQKILLEMNCSLRPDLAPDLCKNLSGIYMFCYRKVVEANTSREIGPLDEAIGILKYQRETWALLLQQLGKARASSAARKLDLPAPSESMEQSIRLSA
jgi:flagellar secretion chaperone FliS